MGYLKKIVLRLEELEDQIIQEVYGLGDTGSTPYCNEKYLSILGEADPRVVEYRKLYNIMKNCGEGK